MIPANIVSFFGTSLLFVCLALPARATDIERDPINYTTAEPHNAIERLQQRLDDGRTTLAHEDGFGYLRPLLHELGVPHSSQTLVFSKTSLQRQRINPRTPRALYFGDDAYVGYCQKGDLIEVTAIDPQLGPVFYSLSQKKDDKPLHCGNPAGDQDELARVLESVVTSFGEHPLGEPPA